MTGSGGGPLRSRQGVVSLSRSPVQIGRGEVGAEAAPLNGRIGWAGAVVCRATGAVGAVVCSVDASGSSNSDKSILAKYDGSGFGGAGCSGESVEEFGGAGCSGEGVAIIGGAGCSGEGEGVESKGVEKFPPPPPAEGREGRSWARRMIGWREDVQAAAGWIAAAVGQAASAEMAEDDAIMDRSIAVRRGRIAVLRRVCWSEGLEV
jgi:hypothetical protein